MANETRVFYAGFSGTISDNPLTNVATTLNSAALASFPTVGLAEYAALVLDPLGQGGVPEIVWMTTHTVGQTTGTIIRGRETAYGTSAGRQHAQGVRWAHVWTALDCRYPKAPMDRLTMRATFR